MQPCLAPKTLVEEAASVLSAGLLVVVTIRFPRGRGFKSARAERRGLDLREEVEHGRQTETSSVGGSERENRNKTPDKCFPLFISLHFLL